MSRVLMVLVLVVALVGCADSNPRLQVSGTVNFKGQPLDHGNIQFLTTDGPPGPAGGAVVKDGKYNLPREHGLEPGTYRVLIRSGVPAKELPPDWPEGASRPTVERIPDEYSSFEKAQHLVEVKPPGPVLLDFSIP